MNDGPNIITTGLVFYVDAGDKNSFRISTDTIWRDLTTTGANGTLVNGTSFSTSNLGCISFDGQNNNYVNFGSGLSQAGSFTISCWTKRNGTQSGNGGVVFGRTAGSDSSYVQNYAFLISPQSYMKFTQSAGSYTTVTSAMVMNNNVWYELTGVYDVIINKLSFYINGIFENSTFLPLNTDPPTTGNQRVLAGASDGTTPTNWFKGSIACIRIYNRTLSDDEIYLNYRVQKTRFGL